MAYSDFTTLSKVRETFGLTIEESIDLFTETSEILPSSYLQTTLSENVFFATAINIESNLCLAIALIPKACFTFGSVNLL